MNASFKWIAIWGMLNVFVLNSSFEGSADDHRHRERARHGWGDDSSKKQSSNQLPPVTNSAYKETCGGCHFPYQPGLLPSASWAQLLASLDDHFGQPLDIDPEALTTLTGYLKGNSADKSANRVSVKIMRSLGGSVPARIKDVPYIREKHHEISSDILNRKSIGSLSNCLACHKTAESGVYKDDFVEIPR
jgi:Dihaem cytochrome c